MYLSYYLNTSLKPISHDCQYLIISWIYYNSTAESSLSPSWVAVPIKSRGSHFPLAPQVLAIEIHTAVI